MGLLSRPPHLSDILIAQMYLFLKFGYCCLRAREIQFTPITRMILFSLIYVKLLLDQVTDFQFS